jgi:hypothetical protein
MDEEFLASVLSREDYRFDRNNLERTLDAWESMVRDEWLVAGTAAAQGVVWRKRLGETIVQRTFVECYGAVLRDLMVGCGGMRGDAWTDEEKLVVAASVLFMEKKYEPFMTLESGEWRLRLLWDMYMEIFRHPQSSDFSRILAASYLLFRPLDTTIVPHEGDDADTGAGLAVFSEVMRIMEKDRDWDAYDLLQRAVDRFPARYGSFWAPLHRFAERYRYDPGTRRGRHHYDVLRAPPAPAPSSSTAPVMDREILGTPEPPEEVPESTAALDRNMFTDSQNIHTAAVQQGTRKSLEVLCRWYGEYMDRLREIDPHYTTPSMEDLVRDISLHFQAESSGKGMDGLSTFLHRVETDPSMIVLFDSTDPASTHPTVVVRLWDVLLWVWTYLRSRYADGAEDAEELARRFLEECNETQDTCFSGHMSRLVNTLVGFLPGIESASISVVDAAVVQLQRALSDLDLDPDDDYLEWMTETDPDAPDYLKFREWVYRYRRCLRDTVLQRLSASGFQDHEMLDDEDPISGAWDRLFPHHLGALAPDPEPVFTSSCRVCWWFLPRATTTTPTPRAQEG